MTEAITHSHVVIRDHSYVAGTSERPEVNVFVQTHTKKRPLNEKILAPKQDVWMKWRGGPIVASAEILSWHAGDFSNGNINKIRNLCEGTSLFGINKYWKSVSEKSSGYFTVVFLSNERWLETPICTKARSHGSSWVYLDTDEKRKLWLTPDVLHQRSEDKKETSRNIPAGLRFDVFRRDNFTCSYCGSKAPEVKLHVDHVIPWKIVKKHEIDNLTTACASCNLGKSDKML